MGDRICIRITDGIDISPTLYCHWMGLDALRSVHEALAASRMEPSNILCNTVIKAMKGTCRDKSFYLYNDGEAEKIAEWDNGKWTFDIRDNTWTTDCRGLEGLRMTTENVEDLINGTFVPDRTEVA